MNEIPLSLYITMMAIAFSFLVGSLLIREDFIRIIFSFISMTMSYINSMVILNGNVVLYQTTGSVYSEIPVQVTSLNYFWLLLAILSALLLLLFVVSLINSSLQSDLDERNAEAERDY